MTRPPIELRDVTVDLPIIGAQSRLLKNRLIASATGGRLAVSGGVEIVRALSSIDLTIAQGERVGLRGHNGAGKTTLLRVLAGAYVPTGGSARIEGQITSLIDVMLGMEPEATGYENIVLRFIAMGRSPREAQRLVPSIAEFSELGDFLRLPVRTYSAGMAMRLAFAASTAVESEILLMDEWLSVGDAAFVGKAQERIRALVDRAQVLVIASHDDALLWSLCNRVVDLDHGSIVRDQRMRETETADAVEGMFTP
jgi:lipopolysaccharide transport system ATP-binding protein